jgi:hypothetical protein
LDKGKKMLKFESQDEIEVYAGDTGFICFKAESWMEKEPRIVALTIGQFRKVIKNADQLILDAEEAKRRKESYDL